MGQYVSTLHKISWGYEIYMLVIDNPFENSAQQVINELFRKIAATIGDRNVIAGFTNGLESDEAEKRFGIQDGDRRPILLIMEKHPNNLISGDKMIKIQLGGYGSDTDKLRDDLHKISLFVRNDNFKGLIWEQRKDLLKKILSKIPYVDIITTAAGFGKSPL
jgi:hypothetical protein